MSQSDLALQNRIIDATQRLNPDESVAVKYA